MIRLNNIALFSLAFVLVQGGLHVYAQDTSSTPVPVGPCDPVRATAGDKKTETQVAPPETESRHVSITLEEAGQRFGEIQNDYFAENATREQKRQAQSDLHGLLDQVNAEHARLEKKGDDNVEINTMARLRDSISNALKEIDSEIGPPKSKPSQPTVKKEPGSTIPSYYVNEAAAEAAAELQAAQTRFRDHWGKKASSEQLSWDGDRNRLLVDMMLSEERLAWDAAGGYSKEERNTLSDPYAAMRNLRNSLADIAKKNQEVNRLLGDMAAFEKQHKQMMQGISEGPHWSGGGRAGYLEIAFVRMAHGLIVDRINAMYLEIGTDQERLLKELQHVNEALSNVVRSRRERGIRNIRQKACQQALQRGQSEPEPFYVHRPVGSVRKTELANRLRSLLTDRLGKSAPQPRMGDVETILDSDKSFTREFDDQVRDRMLNKDN